MIAVLQNLPSPSALLLATPVSEEIYDAITFEPLDISSGPLNANGAVECDRCSWRTTVLGSEQMMLAVAQVQVQVGMAIDGGTQAEEGGRGIVDWMKERSEGCGCGGTWVRPDRRRS